MGCIFFQIYASPRHIKDMLYFENYVLSKSLKVGTYDTKTMICGRGIKNVNNSLSIQLAPIILLDYATFIL